MEHVETKLKDLLSMVRDVINSQRFHMCTSYHNRLKKTIELIKN